MLYFRAVKRLSLSAILVTIFSFLVSGMAMAQYSSSNYKSNEVIFGAGGDNNQASASYNAGVSAGALGVGNYAGTNYKAYSGFLTPNEPFLELQIDTGTVNMGTVDPSTTRTGQANFHVRTYVNTGYSVQTLSQPPTYTSGPSSHTLSAMTTLGSSSTGTEQFGINLVANTSPATFGNDPSPQPDPTYATGVAAPGYNTTNQ